jgi:KDO2-lipid IV(A) lauroyltransferase
MEKVIASAVHGLVLLIQSLPLKLAARLGRFGGMVAWWLDARHRGVMLNNLAQAFPALDQREIRAIARENMRRIGECYVSAIKTASMSPRELEKVCEVRGHEKILQVNARHPSRNCIVAIGHFGNFELYAQLARNIPGLQAATTYRALKQPALNRIMQRIRGRSGCLFFERRTESEALKNALKQGKILLGLLSDQHAGNSAIWTPFLGRNCSTTPAVAILALRYNSPLLTAICYRTSLARWTIEIGDEIPTREAGQPRSVEAIMSDVNRALEAAVLRDPANWFWVHNRWKKQKLKRTRSRFSEAALPSGPAVDTGSP